MHTRQAVEAAALSGRSRLSAPIARFIELIELPTVAARSFGGSLTFAYLHVS